MGTPIRFDGIITSWNDKRGYGFITPTRGGEDIFIHIKDFSAKGARPQIGQAVTFEVEVRQQGKKRALAVKALRRRIPPSAPRSDDATQWGAATCFAILAFFALYLLTSIMWRVPAWVAGIYLVASVFTYALYAADKSAAVNQAWRISESTLLLAGLAGGWPGAIVAQQVLRHKSSKASFRAAFWGTVALNVAAFLLLASPLARQFLPA